MLALELDLDHQHMGSVGHALTQEGTLITSVHREMRRRQKTQPGEPQHLGSETKERKQRKYNGIVTASSVAESACISLHFRVERTLRHPISQPTHE